MEDILTPDITWVTCWYEIDRPYQDPKMLGAVEQLLKLPIKLVLYLSKICADVSELDVKEEIDFNPVDLSRLKFSELTRKVVSLAETHQNNRLVIKYLSELPFQIESGKLREMYNANRNPYFGEQKDTPEYCQLMWNKFFLLSQSSEKNHFNTKYVGWIDVGLGRITPLHPQSFINLNSWLNEHPDKLGEQIRMSLIREPPFIENRQTFYRMSHGYMVCGLMVTQTSFWPKFLQIFYSELEECLNRKIVTLEEKICCWIYRRKPHLFNLYFGDYQDTLVNSVSLQQNFNIVESFLTIDLFISPPNILLRRVKSLWRAFHCHKWNLSDQQQINILICGIIAAKKAGRYDQFWRFSLALEERAPRMEKS